LIQKVFVSFLPTAVVGVIAYPWIKQFLFGNERVVIVAMLFGGIFLVVFELLQRNSAATRLQTISYGQAFLVGLFQCLSMIPGVSRSAATIFGGLSLGIDRTTLYRMMRRFGIQ
jgi:undecaprenyl-diphosphatase